MLLALARLPVWIQPLRRQGGEPMVRTTSVTVDPVCGMSIDPDKAAGMSRIDGQAFYFCSARCNAAFDADPSRYTDHGNETAEAASCCGPSSKSCH
jgi:YHS domain-containing protein